MKGVIIGFGNIAEFAHLPTWRELGVEIDGVVDICAKRRAIAESYGLKSYESIHDIKEEIDFIDISTPPSFRLQSVNFAAENSLDIICEKPIVRPAEIKELEKLCSKIFFFPIHNWKYAPQYKKIKETINGIEKIEMNTYRTTYSRGNADWMPDWRVKYEISGGGILMDHGYHNIYLAMFLLGREFQDAKLKNIEFFNGTKIDKKANFELRFSGGEIAEINLDWNSDKREIKNVFYRQGESITLVEDKLLINGRTCELGYGLSKDSVHRSWYRDVFLDFINKRKSKEKEYFFEGLKVLEGIKELYKQAFSRSRAQ